MQNCQVWKLGSDDQAVLPNIWQHFLSCIS